MRAMVVYESMFGSTRQVAEAVAAGLGEAAEVQVTRADSVPAGALEDVDLVVVGGPTHARSMPRPGTRRGAPDYLRRPGNDLTLEPGADTAPGVREWIAALPGVQFTAAAFDTRVDMSPILTGRASRAIARALARKGARMLLDPASFLVDRRSRLLAGELERARAWGVELASARSRELARPR